jgi:hypothetical protein
MMAKRMKATTDARRVARSKLAALRNAAKPVAPTVKPLAGAMSAVDMARSFNEWMRQYIEAPEAFQATFRTVSEFVAQEAQGKEPDYGDVSARLMFELLGQLNGKAS